MIRMCWFLVSGMWSGSLIDKRLARSVADDSADVWFHRYDKDGKDIEGRCK